MIMAIEGPPRRRPHKYWQDVNEYYPNKRAVLIEDGKRYTISQETMSGLRLNVDGSTNDTLATRRHGYQSQILSRD